MKHVNEFEIGRITAEVACGLAEATAMMCANEKDMEVSNHLSCIFRGAAGIQTAAVKVGQRPIVFHPHQQCAILLWERQNDAIRIVGILQGSQFQPGDWHLIERGKSTNISGLSVAGYQRFKWVAIADSFDGDLSMWPDVTHLERECAL